MVISLVPKDVAEEGYQFTHLGGTETCKECKLLPVCVNSLEIGNTYDVTQVREKEHNCLINCVLFITNAAAWPFGSGFFTVVSPMPLNCMK